MHFNPLNWLLFGKRLVHSYSMIIKLLFEIKSNKKWVRIGKENQRQRKGFDHTLEELGHPKTRCFSTSCGGSSVTWVVESAPLCSMCEISLNLITLPLKLGSKICEALRSGSFFNPSKGRIRSLTFKKTVEGAAYI